MSHEDLKNTGTPEDKTSEKTTLRRHFLKGGAAAAVGAITAASVPKDAGAVVTDSMYHKLDRVSYHPNENLAKAIVEAWKDKESKGFRQEVLTWPNITQASDWPSRSKPDYVKVSKALAKVDIFFEFPVVLTCDQYDWGYVKASKEVIFVLPDTPNSNGQYTVGTAAAAMVICPFGM